MLQIDIRPELKRVLHGRALAAGMTMQAYVLSILREAGLPVRRADLLDRRRHENRKPKPTMLPERRNPKMSAAQSFKAASPELLEKLGLGGMDGLGPCIVVINVDGGSLRKKVRTRVAKARSRRHLAPRRKSK